MPLPDHVAPNELIESAWGNAVVDTLLVLPRCRSVQGVGGVTAGAFPNIQTISEPAWPVVSHVIAWSYIRADVSGGAGTYTMDLVATVAGQAAAGLATWGSLTAGAYFVPLFGGFDIPANVTASVALNGSGNANVTVTADFRVNNLNIIRVATWS